MKRYSLAFCALLLVLVPTACGTHGGQVPASLLPPGQDSVIRPFDTHGGIASMRVEMGDAAPVFFGNTLAHVNLAISEIDVAGNSGKTSVVAQYGSPLLIDLLQYQDGSGGSVGQSSVNEQSFASVRFVVDVSRSGVVYANGSTGSLTFTDGSDNSSAHLGRTTVTSVIDSTHVAITVREPFTIGTSPSELLNVDFNLLESLAPAGGVRTESISAFDTHGGLGLSARPTLFLASNSNEGSIAGTVVNRNGSPVANAVVVASGLGNQAGNSVATDALGHFSLHTLQSGTYHLVIYNDYTTSAGVRLSSAGASSGKDKVNGPIVTIGSGQSADAGTIAD